MFVDDIRRDDMVTTTAPDTTQPAATPRAKMTQISPEELEEIYAFAVELGKKAGQMLMDAAKLRMGGDENGGGSGKKKELETVEKMNAVDLVTETDEGVYTSCERN